MAQAVRLLLLSGLLSASLGLRVIGSPDFSCSQPEIQCSVLNSNCVDLSWIQPHEWTPTAPSHLEVTAGIALNEEGSRVPVLQINWTVSIDSSIRILQGAEISVLEIGSGRTQCVQFQFGNMFPRQRDQNNQPWTFFYNRFEVDPGHEYLISVQHLPKQEEVNRREEVFTVPGCNEDAMMLTDTCCDLGYCWNHNISLKFTESELVVMFTPRRDAQRYGVQVSIRHSKSPLSFQEVDLPKGMSTERRTVIFHNPLKHEECWYNVSVWPYMSPCYTDCVRQWYAQKCPTPPPPPTTTPDLSRQVKMWPIAAAAMIVAFAITIILLCLQACIVQPDPKLPIQPPPVPPPLVKQKVWLVYSADHKHYVDVVIRLADFLRTSWGLEVVLDLHHSLDMSIKGPMDWLVYQKEQIDKTNGIILILCSKGAQAKWRAKQLGPEEQRDDTGYENWDLFTMALHLFCTDFQRSSPYGRYVVAYFSDLSDVGDIPSPFQMCSRYVLTENLQDLLFRIQRIERNQPNVQYEVDVETTSYRHLVKEVERCRAWQETHSDSQVEAKEEESVEEQEEAGEDEDRPALTRRNFPQIRQPETSVSKMTPIILEPDPIRSVNPSLASGPSSVCVVPLLNVEHSAVTIQQPFLNTEHSASYRQQPFLAQVDESLPIYNERLHHIDLSLPIDQLEDLSEAQIRFFSQSILGDQQMNPDMVLYDAEPSPSSEDPKVARLVGLKESLLTVNDLYVPIDQGVQSVDLMEAHGSARAVLDGESLYGSADWLGEEDESVYEQLLQKGISIPRSQDIRPEDLAEAQKKFFLHTILDENIAPGLFLDAESPYLPLTVDADIPLPPYSEPGLQTETLRHNGQGFQPVGLREAQKNWPPHMVLGGPRVTPEMGVLTDEINIYEDSNGPEFAVVGRKNNMHCHSADLGYGSLKQ